jgi:hypothetical protein
MVLTDGAVPAGAGRACQPARAHARCAAPPPARRGLRAARAVARRAAAPRMASPGGAAPRCRRTSKLSTGSRPPRRPPRAATRVHAPGAAQVRPGCGSRRGGSARLPRVRRRRPGARAAAAENGACCCGVTRMRQSPSVDTRSARAAEALGVTRRGAAYRRARKPRRRRTQARPRHARHRSFCHTHQRLEPTARPAVLWGRPVRWRF